jgi:steroid delta-isomerase-like uncharacterized protein
MSIASTTNQTIPTDDQHPLSPAAIHQLLADLVSAWNDHDAERAAAFYAPDYHGSDVGQSSPQIGREARISVLRHYIRAFPDLHFSSSSLVEGQRAVLTWRMTGTHQATIMGIPATGQRIDVKGVSIMEIANGLIVRGTNIWDTAGFLRALRLLPEL